MANKNIREGAHEQPNGAVLLRADAAGKPGRGKIRVYTYGSATVKDVAADRDTAIANVASGQKALQRAKSAFVKTGVNLRHARGIPRFHVDPRHPNVIIRVLDGQKTHGRMVNGSFVPAE